MFILLFLLSQVGCDWVEISQNHYKNEPVHKVINFEYTTKSNRIYRNNSITEKQWHRGVVDKVAHVENIRQVKYPSVKTRHEDNKYFNSHKMTEEDYNFSTKPNIQKFNTHDEDDHQNKVIWTTSVNTDQVIHPYSKPIKKLSTLEVNNYDRSKIFDEIQSAEENSAINQNKHVQISKPPLTETTKNIEKFNSKNNKFYTMATPNFHRLSLKDEQLAVSDNTHSSIDTTKEFSTPKIKLIQRKDNEVKENYVYKEPFPSNTEYSDKTKFRPFDTSTPPHDQYFNSRNKFGNSAVHIDNSSFNNNIKATEEIIVNDANPIQNSFTELGTPSMDIKETISKTEDSRTGGILHVSKVNTLQGLWKLVKLVTDTIYKNKRRSFKGKIKYLEDLKTTILTTIEDQIDRAWPDDGGAEGGGRTTRSAQARGHVEFPSSESTLMTISFLTFAVFVIKLVLQVIHTYKNKTMMVTPAVVAAVGRAAAAFRTPK